MSTRRVVIAGMGTVSSLGNNVYETEKSLRNVRSGIQKNPEFEEMGLRSHVEGPIVMDDQRLRELIDRKTLRFMNSGTAYAHIAMQEAMADSGLSNDDIYDNEKIGLYVGTGGGSPEMIVLAADLLREKGVRKVGPYRVPQTMASGPAACLSTAFRITGSCLSLSSACATSAHCIGEAAKEIQSGRQDIMFAGGCEESHWTMAVLFDAMGALSTKYNDSPEHASRPFDKDRDGFVISGGAGIVVLMELELARKIGAPIHAELIGYGISSDGYDMVQPSGEGAVRCMRQAIQSLGDRQIDYINAHGTSTPIGDVKEIAGILEVFSSYVPPITSTKSLAGHGLGTAGVNEAIHSIIMLNRGFITPTANVNHVDPEIDTLLSDIGTANIIFSGSETVSVDLSTVMSNSFGFGGTNATLVFGKEEGK